MADLIDPDKLKQIVEAALMAAHEPLTVDQLQKLFAHGELDSEAGRAQIRETLKGLEEETATRGYELKRVASGYRYQVRQELSEWVSRLWDEKPPRYSRALLETLALVAYKQPVTRGDIEQVRGVAVSQNIMRTLLERGWIRVVGQREVPGRPSLYGTTREFLDYFGLKSLDQLPPLTEIRSLIEPLVMEAVAEEARAVAEGDHPELREVSSPASSNTESSADAGSEEVRSEPTRKTGEQPEAEAGDGVHGSKQRAEAGEAARAGDGETVAGRVGRAGTNDGTIGGDGQAAGEENESAGEPRGAAGTDDERAGMGSQATRGEEAEEGAGDRSSGRGESAGESGPDEGSSGGEGSSRTPHSAEIVRLPRSPRR